MIAAGNLRERITFQEMSGTTTDAYGGTVPAWIDVVMVRAKYRPLRGRELIAANATQSEATVMFYTRYRDGLTTSMRISFRGQYYDILSIVDVDGRKVEFEITATVGAG